MAGPEHKLDFHLHKGQENVRKLLNIHHKPCGFFYKPKIFAGESVKKKLEEYFDNDLALKRAFAEDAAILK